MFTAEMAKNLNNQNLDRRIEIEVKNAVQNNETNAYLRVYIEDSFAHCIMEELEKRGFHSIQVPDIVLKGDVYFSWKD